MVISQVAALKAEAQAQQDEVLEAARRLAERCKAELGATSVLLFGSRARNDWRRDSDCDVMVISPAFEGMRWHERALAIWDRWDGPVKLEAIGLTEQQFTEAKGKRGLVDMALADGVVELLK